MSTGSDAHVRFTADMEDVQRSLDQIEHNTQSWAQAIRQGIATAFSLQIVETFQHGIESIFSSIQGVFDKSLEEATEHELVMKRLEIALDGVRGGFDFSATSIAEWADELEASTGVSEESIERIAASLARFHVSGENFKNAVQAALNISAATGSSPEAEANKIGRALAGLEQGQVFAIRRMREELADLTEAEKEHISELAKTGRGHEAVGLVMDELNRKYKDAAEIIGNTFHGQMQKVKTMFSNVYEELGMALLPTLEKLMPVFQELAAYAVQLAEAFGKWVRTMAESKTGQEWVETIKNTIMQAAGTVLEFIERVPTYLERIKATIMGIIADVRIEIDKLIANMPPWMAGQGNIDSARADLFGSHEYSQANQKELVKLIAESNALFRMDKNHPDLPEAQRKIDEFNEVHRVGGPARAAQVQAEIDQKRIDSLLKEQSFADGVAEHVDKITNALEKFKQGTAESHMKIESFVNSIIHGPERLADAAKALWSKLGATFENATKESLDKTDAMIEELKEKRFNQLNSGQFLEAGKTALEIQEIEKGQGKKIEDMEARKKALEDIVDREGKTLPFKSAIEDAQSVFRRIQTSAASEPEKEDIPKKQLTELGKIAESQAKQLEQEIIAHKLRAEMSGRMDKLNTNLEKGSRAG